VFLQVDVPMRRWPVANWVLIAVTLVVSLSVFADLVRGNRKLLDSPEPDPAVVRKLDDPRTSPQKKDRLRREEAARLKARQTPDWEPLERYALHTDRAHFRPAQLVTHLFVHADLWHLLGNMVFLFCIGNAVNAKLGHLPFLGLYVGLGVLAGVVSVAFNTGTAVGASRC
jgi:hypothetical protein